MNHLTSPPLVSGVLTVADPRRLSLARKAVNNFIRQHYRPFELVIVNGTETPVLTRPVDWSEEGGYQISELKAEPGRNAAAMKNIGIHAACGDWIIPVDDDDWFHPQRLLFQMACRVAQRPCLLACQLRVDISEPVRGQTEEAVQPLLHLEHQEGGIPETILFPRCDAEGRPWQYDAELNIGEHRELLARMSQQGCDPVAAPNWHTSLVNAMHWPLLSIAMYHGGNELSYEQFFPPQPSTDKRRIVPASLNGTDIEQLKSVLQAYNFRIL